MNILFIGDIVGRPGRNAVKAILPNLQEEYSLDLVFANGENLASGLGMTHDKYLEMRETGIDYFTSGNHIWAKKEFFPYLDDEKIHVLRPANYPSSYPGRGVALITHGTVTVQLINLVGKAFMHDTVEDFFSCIDQILESTKADIRIVDFHAEATSEKAILASYLDGRVTAFLGTHTHVQTADERILPKDTAFQTDVGMTGPINSSLGARIEPYLAAMRTGDPAKYEVASGPVTFNSTLLQIGEDFRVRTILRISKMYDPSSNAVVK